MNQQNNTAPAQHLPQRPRLVLRVGFAGSSDLSDVEDSYLKLALEQLFRAIGEHLVSIVPATPVAPARRSRISAFYSNECPLLRLVTGLCEGADAVAADVLELVLVPRTPGSTCELDDKCLATELAAILPFEVEVYRQSRPVQFQPTFDQQLARCAWVMNLDGKYDKPDDATLKAIDSEEERTQRKALGDQRRSRAYRAQSAFLLRQCDLLIAAADPSTPGKAGGTMQTVREAQIYDLPIVFIHTGTGGIHLVNPEQDFQSTVAGALPDWNNSLAKLIDQLTADPDREIDPNDSHSVEQREVGESLLREYFNDPNSPELGSRKWMVRFRKWAWFVFEKFFSPGINLKPDPELEPYAKYRNRARDLNYHYSGLYRGAFLINYVFAVLAVGLATVSLAVLSTHAQTASRGEPFKNSDIVNTLHDTTSSGASPGWILIVLFALASVKLAILIFILRNTSRANKEGWNDRAVAMRYLAERLRSSYYLPRLGIQQPPVAAAPQFASRVIRQSVVDWLFDSITRCVSLADLPGVKPYSIRSYDGKQEITVKRLITFDVATEVERVRDQWIAEQVKYHERTAKINYSIHRTADTICRWLGRIVIAIVCFDLAFIICEALEKDHLLPAPMVNVVHALSPYIPWIIVLTALLPSIVAALGGIKFQSECARLAERSAVLRVRLGGRVNAQTEKGLKHSVRDPWRIIVLLFTMPWNVVRKALGHPPESSPVQYNGGRWQEADFLATEIRTHMAEPQSDLGSWSHDALRLMDRVATDLIHEVAEWTVLYAKEVSEPG